MKWINWFDLPILYWPIPIVLHNLTGSNLTGDFSPFFLELESQHFFSLMRYHLYLKHKELCNLLLLIIMSKTIFAHVPQDFRFAILMLEAFVRESEMEVSCSKTYCHPTIARHGNGMSRPPQERDDNLDRTVWCNYYPIF